MISAVGFALCRYGKGRGGAPRSFYSRPAMTPATIMETMAAIPPTTRRGMTLLMRNSFSSSLSATADGDEVGGGEAEHLAEADAEGHGLVAHYLPRRQHLHHQEDGGDGDGEHHDEREDELHEVGEGDVAQRGDDGRGGWPSFRGRPLGRGAAPASMRATSLLYRLIQFLI